MTKGNYNADVYNAGHRNAGPYNAGNCNAGAYNAGDYNSGEWNANKFNTGSYNTGDHNTGDHNTGDHNTGEWNTGYWNTGSFHVGCFNTISAEKAYYFNKLIDKKEWDAARKPNWLSVPSPTTWMGLSEMTGQEKADNPSCAITGGYLRVNDIKEEWRKAYETASQNEIQAVRDLPGFDYDVFEQITGLDLRENPQKSPSAAK